MRKVSFYFNKRHTILHLETRKFLITVDLDKKQNILNNVTASELQRMKRLRYRPANGLQYKMATFCERRTVSAVA